MRTPQIGEIWIGKSTHLNYEVVAIGPMFVSIRHSNGMISTCTIDTLNSCYTPPKKMIKIWVNLYRYESGNQGANAFLTKREADNYAIGKCFIGQTECEIEDKAGFSYCYGRDVRFLLDSRTLFI